MESTVKQGIKGIGTCFIMAPIYGLIKHDEKAFKNLITDDPEHNRVTVHLYYKGEPYDIEMDRTYISDSQADFTGCSEDVNLVIKALLITGLTSPGPVSEMLYENKEEAYRFKEVIKYTRDRLDGGNPIAVMSALGANMKAPANFGFQKYLSEKAENSVQDISDDVLRKLETWCNDKNKVVTLSVYTVINHAVTLTGVNRKKKTITYYDQQLNAENTVPLESILPDSIKTDEENPRLDQILCFQVGQNSCRTESCEMLDISSIRQAVRNKKKINTEEEVIARIVDKFSNSFNEAWKEYAKENPQKMNSIVREVLSSNGLNWEKWNNKYQLEKMFDAGKYETAYEEEYKDKQTVFNGIKQILQSSPDTSRDASEIGIAIKEKVEQLNKDYEFMLRNQNKRLLYPDALAVYTNLFDIYRNFDIKDIDATSAEQQFPESTRNPQDFLQKAGSAKRWLDAFLKAFNKDNNLTAETFNDTPEGRQILKEENIARNNVPTAAEIFDDGKRMLEGGLLTGGYIKLLVASDKHTVSTNSDKWNAVLASAAAIADAEKNHRPVGENQLRHAYKACRIYLDKHTDNGRRQNIIDGQSSEGGRLRKAAVVNYLKILEKCCEEHKEGFENIRDDYRQWCRKSGKREYVPLNFRALESSLAENIDKNAAFEAAGHKNEIKAYAELNIKTKLKLDSIKTKMQNSKEKLPKNKAAEKKAEAIKV